MEILLTFFILLMVRMIQARRNTAKSMSTFYWDILGFLDLRKTSFSSFLLIQIIITPAYLWCGFKHVDNFSGDLVLVKCHLRQECLSCIH